MELNGLKNQAAKVRVCFLSSQNQERRFCSGSALPEVLFQTCLKDQPLVRRAILASLKGGRRSEAKSRQRNFSFFQSPIINSGKAEYQILPF